MEGSWTMIITIEFTCPFCGLKCEAGYENDMPAVLHAMPFCSVYGIDEGADEYLRRVSEEYQRRSQQIMLSIKRGNNGN